ncbi:MAG TPA: mechanosensitive ion channel domain-containing protein [Streptosporangiaceae bacterium]|nr:mechanosensitive ion channel domain-containing protein [Streptosporangiaceae bacterium]
MERQQGRHVDAASGGDHAGRRSTPWRAILTLVLAVACLEAVRMMGVPLDKSTPKTATMGHFVIQPATGHVITIAGAAAFCVLGLVSAFGFATWARSMLQTVIGAAYAAVGRYVMVLAGISVVAIVTLAMLSFPVKQLVVGGAVTGVLISIAAQQSLANLFAGVMLQFARPFRVGDRVRVRSGALAGTIEGTVTEFSITYVRLETAEGQVLLPNAQVLAAAVSPVRLTDQPGATS